ncbi:MAG: hypothetical protein A2W05_05285 [Candidatus Schekmanbacteria bacterium RBG_16_38_10]|uniref:Aminomethyltransferase n=1 Tax=Candidatus Schekmanbacteria bacterium RBG_16_38_10 TaxID=1817879 RepID=A0A1F7RTA1_9BACT|nr:MAG: hypothetical protein A2W05_05285 [Candidatus Schekmanbacteria bacterium RBG_16_38_10]
MRTPLYQLHLNAGAKVVDFHGWDMPLQYVGIIDEHRNVRKNVGIFDLSHMGRIFISGKDSNGFLQRLLTIDITKLKVGTAKYCFFLNEKGGILDDLIVYKDEDKYMLVVNASNRNKILGWLDKNRGGVAVNIDDMTMKIALIAIQGPKSEAMMKSVFNIDLSALKYYRFTKDGLNIASHNTKVESIIARTGYTGEDGFELFFESQYAEEIWRLIIDGAKQYNISPIGLGARDTLRLEAGMSLYGQEINEEITPIEAGLEFAISFDKEDYVGKAALMRIKENGLTRRVIGFELLSKRIPRPEMSIYNDSQQVGFTTSGTFSPTFEKSIGMGYVNTKYASIGARLQVDIRGKREYIVIVKLPFYTRKA